MEESLRLQKFLANQGIASRRKCEEYIKNGKVKVNGDIILELGLKVNPKKDVIMFNDRIIANNNDYVYILLNKPIRICYNCKRPI